MARPPSPRRGDRRLAPRGLGSGRRARADAKRGGTLVFRLLGPDPVCLNVLLTPCGRSLGGPDWVEKVLQTPFEVGPDFTYEESLVSRVTARGVDRSR